MATAQQDWRAAATASLEMHQALVALHGSPRISSFFDLQLAQLRVVFWGLRFERDLQSGWVEHDREIVDLIIRGKRATAVELMDDNLDDSRVALIDEVRSIALGT